jgi:uncharacterized membrane-anchored protein YhcB (DUF1043 family)
LQDITSSSNNYNDLARPLRNTTNAIQNFKDLVSSVDTTDLPCGWALAKSDSDSLRIVYLEESENNCTQDPKITKSVTILSDLTWELRILNRVIKDVNSPGLEYVKKYLQRIKTTTELLKLLIFVQSVKICCGNPEFSQPESTVGSNCMVGENTVFYSSVVKDTNYEFKVNGTCYKSTLRNKNCHLLVKQQYDRCSECSKQRKYLNVLRDRQHKQSTESSHFTGKSSHVNYRYLTSDGKTEKLRTLQQELKSTKIILNNLRSKIDKKINKEGQMLDKEMNDYLHEVLKNGDHLKEELPEGSFRKLFWQQQMKALSCNDARQMRWHPLMIKWCLNIKLRSTAAYKAMRNSGFLKLPSERTLRDYTHWTKMSSGFQPSTFEQLLVEASYKELKDWQKFIVLLHDEVKIQNDLVYCKHTGELIGFANLGEINNSLVEFEKQCQDEMSRTPDIASYMLVFMVRGVTTTLEYPVAHFPCGNCFTADFLFPLVWDAIRHLETIGFSWKLLPAHVMELLQTESSLRCTGQKKA